jgi:hypothetical protein
MKPLVIGDYSTPKVKWTKLRPDVHQLWCKQTDPANGSKVSYLHLIDEITVNFHQTCVFGRIMMMKISGAVDTDLI